MDAEGESLNKCSSFGRFSAFLSSFCHRIRGRWAATEAVEVGIPEIQPHHAHFYLRFLKSEVTGRVSCSNFSNPGVLGSYSSKSSGNLTDNRQPRHASGSTGVTSGSGCGSGSGVGSSSPLPFGR